MNATDRLVDRRLGLPQRTGDLVRRRAGLIAQPEELAILLPQASEASVQSLSALDDLPGVEELKAAGLLDARVVPAGLSLGAIASGEEQQVEDEESEPEESVEALSDD